MSTSENNFAELLAEMQRSVENRTEYDEWEVEINAHSKFNKPQRGNDRYTRLPCEED